MKNKLYEGISAEGMSKNMLICSNCGKRMPPGKKKCTYCKRPNSNAKERKIPVVTAIVALVFYAVIVLGTVVIITTRVRERAEPGSDVGLQLDGTWATESLTFNDEHIIYVFYGNSFSSTTERTLFDANPEALDDLAEFYRVYHGATIDTEYIGDGNYLIRITKGGTFILDGYSIFLIKGEGLLVAYMFDWDGVGIYIDGYRFVRQ